MKRTGSRCVTIIAAVFLCTIVYTSGKESAADTPDLTTDRPDQTESSVTVEPGYIQVEAGMTISHTGDYDVTEAPGTLVRIGVTDRIEARIGIEGWIFDEEKDTEGFGDSEIGVKVSLFGQDGWIPESAILAGVCVPTAKTVFEGERYDPALKCSCRNTSLLYAASHQLTDRLSAGYNLGIGWECYKGGDGDRHFNAYTPYSVALGIGIMEHLGGFVEFFGGAPINPSGKPANLVDGGLTFLVLDNLQFDIAGGAGISDAAEDWFFGAGVSYRYPR